MTYDKFTISVLSFTKIMISIENFIAIYIVFSAENYCNNLFTHFQFQTFASITFDLN